MCLSIYVGTTHPLSALPMESEGELGVEPASWKPAPLQRMEHVYYVGQKGSGHELGCSCLLNEYLDWAIQPPAIVSDDLYPEGGPCPFDVLRAYCEQVLEQGGKVVIASDDSGGVEQKSQESDYDDSVLFIDEIRRGRMIFSGSRNDLIACRAQLVLRANG